MAKIYETQVDVEREKLARAAAEANNSYSSLRGSGISSIAFGMTSIFLNDSEKAVSKLAKKIPRFTIRNNVLSLFGAALAIVGVASLALGFAKRSKARVAEEKLEKLGPQEVVSPEGLKAHADASEDAHVKRLVAQAESGVDLGLGKR